MPEPTIIKTDAITLRISPFSNTSQVVTWLTPDHGRLATVIKGALRPRRDSAGQYDLGYRCELLYYERSHNGLHAFKECTALENRRACRGNWQATAALSYLCHLAVVAAPENAASPEIHALLAGALSELESRPPPHDLLCLWFELRLLDLLGTAPRLHHCVACRTLMHPGAPALFSSAAGGLVCEACAPRRGSAAARLDAGTLSLLRRMQRSASFASLRALGPDAGQRTRLAGSLRHFMSHHLDLAPGCRAVAFQMLNLNVAPGDPP